MDESVGHGLYIFGYGSLVSNESVARTLQRNIAPEFMPIALLHDYARDWEIRVPIVFADGRACNGRFLDIAPAAGAMVNGVLIPVTEAEVEVLGRREAQYDAVDVSAQIQGPLSAQATVIVFRGRAEFRRDTSNKPSVRPENYRRLVEAAAATRGEEFFAQFRATTKELAGTDYRGKYQFADLEQELAARPPIR